MNNQKALFIDKKNVVKTEKNPYIWRQVYLEGKTEKTVKFDMHEMSEKHIKKAALKCQHKIAELYRQANGWEDLLEKFEKVAQEKKFEIDYIENTYVQAIVKERTF
jgi:hypothetical protein